MNNFNCNKLIVDHIPLANKLAWKYKKMVPSYVEYDDLQSAAYFGLVDAASRYKPEKGCFSSFVFLRIIGEIKDYIKRNTSKISVISIFQEKNNIEIENRSKNNEFENKDLLNFAIKPLNAIAKKVINLYYIEGKSMKEIGAIFNISEGRISQMIKEYLGQMKKCCDKLAA